MGFQQLLTYLSGNDHLLKPHRLYHTLAPVPFIETELATSRILTAMPDDVLNIFKQQAVAAHFHNQGVGPEQVAAEPRLKDTIRILATNLDEAKHPFISLFEHKTMPIYGSQFHPVCSDLPG